MSMADIHEGLLGRYNRPGGLGTRGQMRYQNRHQDWNLRMASYSRYITGQSEADLYPKDGLVGEQYLL